MLKVDGSRMRTRVRASYRVTGSVLQGTVQAEMVDAEAVLELESPDAPARVARVIRNTEQGCFVMQALLRPVPVASSTMLNGEPLRTE